MALARRVGPALMDGKPVSAASTGCATRSATCCIYGPLRNTLGFSRVRVAYTAGEAIGPDLFTFYRSIGINLKQLYGSTETAVFVCLQPDHEAQGRHGRRADRRRRDQAGRHAARSWSRSPGLLQGVLQEPGGDRRGADAPTAGTTPATPASSTPAGT